MANNMANQRDINLYSALDMDCNQTDVVPFEGVTERNGIPYNKTLHKMNRYSDINSTSKRFFTSDGNSYTVSVEDNNYVLRDQNSNTLHTVQNKKFNVSKLSIKKTNDMLCCAITPDGQLMYVDMDGNIKKTNSTTSYLNIASYLKKYDTIKCLISQDSKYFILWGFSQNVEISLEHEVGYVLINLDNNVIDTGNFKIDFTRNLLGKSSTISKLTNVWPVINNVVIKDSTYSSERKNLCILWNYNGLQYESVDTPLPISNSVWCLWYDGTNTYETLSYSDVGDGQLKMEEFDFLYARWERWTGSNCEVSIQTLNNCTQSENQKLYPIQDIQYLYVRTYSEYVVGGAPADEEYPQISVPRFSNVISSYDHLNNYSGQYTGYSFVPVKVTEGKYGNLTGSTFYMNGYDDSINANFGAILVNRGYGYRPNGVITRGDFRLLISGAKASEPKDTLSDDHIMGISISNTTDSIGTLVVPWYFIDDDVSVTYSISTNKLYFLGTDNNFYEIYTSAGTVDDVKLYNDSAIIFNTVDVKNYYELESGNTYHFASDWNNRLIFGYFLTENDNTGYFHDTEEKEDTISFNSGINANYEVTQLPVASMHQNNIVLVGGDAPNVIYDYQYENKETLRVNGSKGTTTIPVPTISFDPSSGSLITSNSYQTIDLTFDFTLDMSKTQHQYINGVVFKPNQKKNLMMHAMGSEPIDIYIGDTAQICVYMLSMYNGNYFANSQLNSVNYPVNTLGDYVVNLPIEFEILPTMINEFYAQLIDSIHKMITYNNGNLLPLYNGGSGLSAITRFFCLQGQMFCIKNNNIYTATYDSNNIVSSSPVVNIQNLEYIGNTPNTAFFFASGIKKIYSFTGARQLTEVASCSQISSVTAWGYDPATTLLFVATPDFVLAFNEQYMTKFNVAEITDFDFTQKGFVLYRGNDCYYYTYNSISIDGMTDATEKIKLTTKFYGEGLNRVSVIDCYYIKLYSPDRKKGDLTVRTRSLTNISCESDEKTYHITPEMWDKNTNMCYIRHTPQLQRGQGISLSLESDFDLFALQCSQVADSTVQLTNERISTSTVRRVI